MILTDNTLSDSDFLGRRNSGGSPARDLANGLQSELLVEPEFRLLLQRGVEPESGKL